MNQIFAFCKIHEWLKKGTHISKNQIHYVGNEAAISRNVAVRTFGPPCSWKYLMLMSNDLQLKSVSHGRSCFVIILLQF